MKVNVSITTPRGGAGFNEATPFKPSGDIEFIPLTFNRRSGRRIVVYPGLDGEQSTTATNEPNPIIQALARGFDWQDALNSGKYTTQRELAKAVGVTRSYVSRLTRLTRLAPDIIESLLAGREPSGLSIETLTLQECPMEWHKQRQILGFPPLK